MVIKLPTGKIATTLKEAEEFMIPPEWCERKMDGVADSVSPEAKCLMESSLMNEGMKLTLKILLIMVMPIFS